MTLWKDLVAGGKDTPEHLKKGNRTLVTLEVSSGEEAPKGSLERRARETGLSLEDFVVKVLDTMGGSECVGAAKSASMDMIRSAGTEQVAHMAVFFSARAVTDMLCRSKSAPDQALTVLAKGLEGCARDLREAAKRRDKK
jgi:hypothetical protein